MRTWIYRQLTKIKFLDRICGRMYEVQGVRVRELEEEVIRLRYLVSLYTPIHAETRQYLIDLIRKVKENRKRNE